MLLGNSWNCHAAMSLLLANHWNTAFFVVSSFFFLFKKALYPTSVTRILILRLSDCGLPQPDTEWFVWVKLGEHACKQSHLNFISQRLKYMFLCSFNTDGNTKYNNESKISLVWHCSERFCGLNVGQKPGNPKKTHLSDQLTRNHHLYRRRGSNPSRTGDRHKDEPLS